ncbi:hypothetical protein [Streptomyces sp. NPDC059247]|uniref:hypothetical protein n=1 Tax=Streptomyces sp. NPDC059247 TaxID=3346790 RepID=UPI0036BF5041
MLDHGDADAQEEAPPHLLGSFVVDERNRRFGRVFGLTDGTLTLRRPGGGAEWSAPAACVRRPTAEEWASIRLLITPVRREGP